jgi:hypothetical protein
VGVGNDEEGRWWWEGVSASSDGEDGHGDADAWALSVTFSPTVIVPFLLRVGWV